MASKLCHPKDAAIQIEDGRKALYDSDGYRLFVFGEADLWTDAQIMTALNFANEAYRCGARSGRAEKAYEIRRALGFDLEIDA